MSKIYKKTKAELKSIAKDIRGVKSTRKPLRDENGNCIKRNEYFYKYPEYDIINKHLEECTDEYTIQSLKREFRHKHIAFCEFFHNTKREEIEPKTRTDYNGCGWKRLDESLINVFKNDFKLAIEKEEMEKE